ncbi:hypothetical protein LTR27_009989 [Elasticomyces elasticus]|nr:hypothetical protein LTR27_009989 [Elasticomyces elasticus]
MINAVVTDAFREIFSRKVVDLTFELFAAVTSALASPTRISSPYVVLQKLMVGYAGVSEQGSTRTLDHVHHVLLPEIFGPGQKFDAICRERCIIPKFILMMDEQKLTPPDTREGMRELSRSVTMIGLGLVQSEDVIHITRRAHLTFATELQPPDLQELDLFGANGELSILSPIIPNAYTTPQYPCRHNQCKEMFTTIPKVVDHMSDVHGMDYYVCREPDCKKGCPNSTALAAHSVTHSDDRPYICSDCGLGFKLPASLTDHRKYWCKILVEECSAPNCNLSLPVPEMWQHCMLAHDYCLDCDHILTYDKDAVSDQGTGVLRQQHIDVCDGSGELGIKAFARYKCTATASCSYTNPKQDHVLTHMPTAHYECKNLCGHIFHKRVAQQAGVGKLAIQDREHAEICNRNPEAERRALLMAPRLAGMVCGIGSPPCPVILASDKAKRATHIGAHEHCGSPGCQHIYPTPKSLADRFHTKPRLPAALAQEIGLD